jgi:hypothetical protein
VLGPLHGYGIARRIERVSGNQVLLGTIYASQFGCNREAGSLLNGGPQTTTGKRVLVPHVNHEVIEMMRLHRFRKVVPASLNSTSSRA